MFSYFRQFFSMVYIISSYNNSENDFTPDTIIHIDPENMTVDIETGHLILITHLEDNEDTFKNNFKHKMMVK
jgi:hypothetical protein